MYACSPPSPSSGANTPGVYNLSTNANATAAGSASTYSGNLFGYLWLEAAWLENNNAAIGGAVYADQATVVYANASTFTRNVASVKGDAVGAMLPVAIDPCTSPAFLLSSPPYGLRPCDPFSSLTAALSHPRRPSLCVHRHQLRTRSPSTGTKTRRSLPGRSLPSSSTPTARTVSRGTTSTPPPQVRHHNQGAIFHPSCAVPIPTCDAFCPHFPTPPSMDRH